LGLFFEFIICDVLGENMYPPFSWENARIPGNTGTAITRNSLLRISWNFLRFPGKCNEILKEHVCILLYNSIHPDKAFLTGVDFQNSS